MVPAGETSILSTRKTDLGGIPIISLASACGLVSIAISNVFGRQGLVGGEFAFWFGLVILVLPIAFRLTSVNASRGERISLVVLAGVGLYLIKVMHSPFGFTFTDEYVHSFNVTQILHSGSLYKTNPILSVTPYFPGLEIVTAALVSMGGISVFSAGLIVIGLARLILMLSLYLFYEQVGRSPRVASIAALLYASNPNFLFWSGQFSYESLALPLVFFILFIIARRDLSPAPGEYRPFTVAAVLGIAAVVITHHMSSYFLAAFLILWVFLAALIKDKRNNNSLAESQFASVSMSGQERVAVPLKVAGNSPVQSRATGPKWLALLALLLSLSWLFFFAKPTMDYLSPVFIKAVRSIYDIVAGLQAPRQLFSSSVGNPVPAWQRIIAIGSVLLMIAGVPWGILGFWRHHLREGMVVLLVLMGLGYFEVLVLRLSPQAWETANRASEFLFLGLAFLLAIGACELVGMKGEAWGGRSLIALGVVIIFMGGIIAGWLPELILQQPFQVRVGNTTIVPQGQSVAKWFLAVFGPENKIGADPTTARIMMAYGDQLAYSGSTPDIQDILATPGFDRWQLQELRSFSIRYLVVDRRPISHVVIAAASFDLGGTQSAITGTKFDGIPGVDRILDGGNIIVYDFRRDVVK